MNPEPTQAPQSWSPMPPTQQPPRDDRQALAQFGRYGAAAILLLVFAIALINIVMALMEIADVWFERQYQPMANALIMLIVAALCAVGLRYVLVRKPADP